MEPFCTWYPSLCSVRKRSGMEPFLRTEYSAHMRNRVVPPNWWNVLVPPTPNPSLTETRKSPTPNPFLPHDLTPKSTHPFGARTNQWQVAGKRASDREAGGRQTAGGGGTGQAERVRGGRRNKQAPRRSGGEQAGMQAEQAGGGAQPVASKSAGDGPLGIGQWRTGIGRPRGELVDS
jgi:hypothetical protein